MIADIIDIKTRQPNDYDEDLVGINDSVLHKTLKEAKNVAKLSVFARSRHNQVYHIIDLYRQGLPPYDIKESLKTYLNCMEHEFSARSIDKSELTTLRRMVNKMDLYIR